MNLNRAEEEEKNSDHLEEQESDHQEEKKFVVNWDQNYRRY